MRHREGLASFPSKEPQLPDAPSHNDIAPACTQVRQASLRRIAAQWDATELLLGKPEGMFASAILKLRNRKNIEGKAGYRTQKKIDRDNA